jgi:predicted O-linked N-acetylglucosamine transferase (SPINDLY family)
MPWFDFVIADRYALPEELTPYFTEKPLYVDGSFIPLTKDETPVREATRAEFGLPEDAFVMAAFGNVYKITEEMFNVWLEILKKAPKSVVWLIDDNKSTTRNLTSYALSKGADVSRIVFTSRAAHAEYLAKLRLADVFLDTFPYNCGSTAIDVLNMNVPLITKYGRSMVSNMGRSLLNSTNRQGLYSQNNKLYLQNVIDVMSNKKIKSLHRTKINTKKPSKKWHITYFIELFILKLFA